MMAEPYYLLSHPIAIGGLALAGFLSPFCPWGGGRQKKRDCMGQVHICVHSTQQARGLLGHQQNLHLSSVNYDFCPCILCYLATWWNLGLLSHKIYICQVKIFVLVLCVAQQFCVFMQT